MVYLTETAFGTYKNEPVKKFTWKTDSGYMVTVISYGAIVQSVQRNNQRSVSNESPRVTPLSPYHYVTAEGGQVYLCWDPTGNLSDEHLRNCSVPDKNGIISDVALGFDDLDSYVERNALYLGAPIGRCANRIRGATFQIDGVRYNLTKNRGDFQLHGGFVGFDKVNWTSTVDGNKVIFSYLSKDGEEGYPGDVVTNITYELTESGSLLVDYQATTTKKTIVNLTNHSYFNLAGHDAGAAELYNHAVSINADKITEADSDTIPTGRFIKVGGTPFDLRTAKRLGDAIDAASTLYDNNFCVSNYGNKGLNFVSRVTHPPSGRYLEVFSDQPGVQFYTSNFLPSPDEPALEGKGGVGYRRHGAFCLETQNYPDAINHPNFPNSVLKPGDVYVHKVVYAFGVDKACDPAVVSA